MEKNDRTNVAEKQRIRDAIADEVQRFLDNGGHITVVNRPTARPASPRGSTWPSSSLLPTDLD